MAMKSAPPFDPKAFLAKVGDGRSIGKYRKNQTVFSQGEPADAVFYIQKGKVKITVVSAAREGSCRHNSWCGRLFRRRLSRRTTAAHRDRQDDDGFRNHAT